MFYRIGLHLYMVHALQYVMESNGVGDNWGMVLEIKRR